MDFGWILESLISFHEVDYLLYSANLEVRWELHLKFFILKGLKKKD